MSRKPNMNTQSGAATAKPTTEAPAQTVVLEQAGEGALSPVSNDVDLANEGGDLTVVVDADGTDTVSELGGVQIVDAPFPPPTDPLMDDGAGSAGGLTIIEDAIVATPAFVIVVICHVKGGRRRAGRRWEEGETPLTLDELTQEQIGTLQGDPLFTVVAYRQKD